MKLSLTPIWSFYFLFKLYLFIRGSIKFDIVFNILFLIYIIIPLPYRIARYKTLRIFRGILNVLLAFLLLWYDSWLPPIISGSLFLHQQGMPSFGYLISFVRGFYDMSLIIASILLVLISLIVRKYKITATVLIAILIITVPLVLKGKGQKTEDIKFQVQTTEAEEVGDPKKYLESFYSTEAERVILFKPPESSASPFDIVILHVCSLSWDDLKEIGMTQDHPFFRQFDYLFTNFNTATGYSGPAVSRLLQANCGQRSHKDIHDEKRTPRPCLILEGLSSLGYKPYVSMEHDGNYGDFIKEVKRNVPAHTVFLMPTELRPDAIFFDGKSPLYNDYTMLKRWFDTRKSSKSERAVLYYNTVLLHAGSHWVDEKKWWKRDKHEQFKDVLTVLLRDLQKFIDLLKSSKRNTVLLFVPEHGRALTGSPFQPADIRDIPLPKITKVPVGVKIIGSKFNDKKMLNSILSQSQQVILHYHGSSLSL